MITLHFLVRHKRQFVYYDPGVGMLTQEDFNAASGSMLLAI